MGILSEESSLAPYNNALDAGKYRFLRSMEENFFSALLIRFETLSRTNGSSKDRFSDANAICGGRGFLFAHRNSLAMHVRFRAALILSADNAVPAFLSIFKYLDFKVAMYLLDYILTGFLYAQYQRECSTKLECSYIRTLI